MAKYIILTMLVVLWLWTQPILAADTGNGKIEGRLINKTSGSSSIVADQQIVMEVVNNNALVVRQTTQSASDGKFIFEGLSIDSSYLYIFGVTYQGAYYNSQPVQFNSGETAKSIEIDVYDVTNTDENISVMMSHAILSFSDNMLNMKEYFLVTNNSDLTFIGKNPPNPEVKRETLKFSLPEDATNFKSGNNLTNYRIEGTDVILSDPVTPKGRDISFSYVIPVNSDKYTFSFKVNYTINRFDLLLQDQNIKVSGAKLIEEAPLSIAGQVFRDYSINDLVAGDTITVQLSALGTPVRSNVLNWAWLSIIPIIIIGFVLLKRTKAKSLTVPEDKERLLADIAELDDRYEEKTISQEAYLKLRNKMKRQVMRLMEEEEEKGKR